MKLTIESGLTGDVSNREDLAEFLCLVDGKASTFAILEKDDGHFIQTALIAGGFVVEKQLGGLDQHFEAVSPIEVPMERDKKPFWKRLFSPRPEQPGPFALEQVVDHFSAFAGFIPEPEDTKWRKVPL